MLDFIFPKTCYICQKEGDYLCNECFKRFIKVDPINKCHICNRESRIGFVHNECRELTYLEGVVNLTVYDGVIKNIIYDIKYNYYFAITETLGKIMSDFLQFYSFNSYNTVLTFVPTSKKKYMLRGFNQSELLTRHLSKYSGINCVKFLSKTHNTGAQAKLHKFERAENLKDAFILHENISKESNIVNIIIVDDVFTTGATLNECAKIIKSKFPKVNIFGFVIAKARD